MAEQVPASTDVASRKRRKVAMACRTCRDRKTRCDGARPVCSPCRRRNVATGCVYEENGSSTRNKYILELENRLKRLESSSALEREDPGARSTCNSDETLVNSTFMRQLPYSQSPSITPGPDLVDALATVDPSHDDEALYGDSSSIAFVRRITNAGNKKRPSADWRQRPITLEPVREKDESAAVYPVRRIANDLLRCFWEFVHPLFPILHRPTFMEQYERFWSSQEDSGMTNADHEVENVLFAATLNLVFTLGCRYSAQIPVARKRTTAEEFYQRAKKLFIFDPLDSLSFPLLQMLLLQGVFLQSTTCAARCWNMIGLAVRIAQGLGLHVDGGMNRTESQLKREMRRRVWHTCLILDRLVAAAFGRPTMIDKSWDVKLPQMIDDEYLQTEGEGMQPQHSPSQLGTFVHTSRLFSILEEILSTFYSHGAMHSGGENDKSTNQPRHRTLMDIMELNFRLDEYLALVPSHMKTTVTGARLTESDNGTYARLHEHALSCRFLYTRVLLLRPVFFLAPEVARQPSDISPGYGLDLTIMRQTSDLCVTTASHLINGIYEKLESPYRIADWHCVYITFAAITTLLAAFKCPVVDQRLLKDTFENSWTRSLNILQHFENQVHVVSRAVLALQELRGRMMPTDSHDKQSFTPVPNTVIEPPLFDGSEHSPPDLTPDMLVDIDSIEFSQSDWSVNPNAWLGQQLFSEDWSDLFGH